MSAPRTCWALTTTDLAASYDRWACQAEQVAAFLSSRIENVRGFDRRLTDEDVVSALRAEVLRAQRRQAEGRRPLHDDLVVSK